jgi:plastocyanin
MLPVRLLRTGALCFALVGAAVACSSDDDSSSDTTAAAATTAAGAATTAGAGSGCPTAGENEIVICQFAFAPADLSVPAGTEVTWRNADDFNHTATGESFDSEPIEGGTTFSHTFDTAGSFPYVCTIHSGMAGTVTVT